MKDISHSVNSSIEEVMHALISRNIQTTLIPDFLMEPITQDTSNQHP